MPPRKRAKQFQRTFIGCWTCRRRKVKCDATKPHCDRCTKSKLVCEGYDIKLNWSTPLTTRNGELLAGDDLLDEKVKDKEKESAFKRSHIALCKWFLYDCYEDIDDDLSMVDAAGSDYRKGPFTCFRHSALLERSERVKQTDQIEKEKEKQKDIINLASIPLIVADNGVHVDLFDNNYLVNNLPNLRLFGNVSLSLFDESFGSDLQTLIKTSIGDYLLDNSHSFAKSLLSEAVIIALLNKSTYKDLQHREVQSLTKSIDDSLTVLENNEHFVLIVILLIMINSNLGIYQPKLFHYKMINGMSPLNDFYKFLQITNQFYNYTQFEMDNRFEPIYEDLEIGYNLLKDIPTYLNKSKKAIKRRSRISISTRETHPDQIIKIPKYIEDKNDNEPPPPTFTIHFNQNDSDSEEALEEENNGYNYDSKEKSTTPTIDVELFKLDDKNDDKIVPILGISKHLLELYYNLIQLINQKYKFQSKFPRNFPKLCSEFEEVLIKSLPFHLIKMSNKDEIFYDFLLLVFFKYVKNYPITMLEYHFNRLKKNNMGLGVIKYVINSIQMNLKDDRNGKIWGNETIMKQHFTNSINDKEFYFV